MTVRLLLTTLAVAFGLSCLATRCLAGGVTVADPLELEAVLNATTSDCVISLLPGAYSLPHTLDYRNKTRVDLHGEGAYLVRDYLDPNFVDKPMVDMTGSSYCTWTGVVINDWNGQKTEADDPNAPACLVFLGRSGETPAGNNIFKDCMFQGRPRTACVINIASEFNTWYSCRFDNYATVLGHVLPIRRPAYAVVVANGYTNSDILSQFSIVTTLDDTITEGATRSLCFYNCEFGRKDLYDDNDPNQKMDPNDATILLDGGANTEDDTWALGNILIESCRFSTGPGTGPSGGTTSWSSKAHVLWSDGGNADTVNNQLVMRECYGEGGPRSVFWGVAGRLYGLTMLDNVWHVAERHIVTEFGMQLYDANIAEMVVTAEYASYDWGYAADGVTPTVWGDDDDRRVLADISFSDHGRFEYGNDRLLGIRLDSDQDTVGNWTTRGSHPTGYYLPWSAIRIRDTSVANDVTVHFGSDALAQTYPTNDPNQGVLLAQHVRQRGQLGTMVLQGFAGVTSASGYLKSPMGAVVYSSTQGVIPAQNGSVVGLSLQVKATVTGGGGGTPPIITLAVRQNGSALSVPATLDLPLLSATVLNAYSQVQPGMQRFSANSPLGLYLTIPTTTPQATVTDVQAIAILAFE